MQRRNVCVVGGGIVGLTTALLAQEKGAHVTIISDKFNKSTSSYGAVGLFAPSTLFHVQSSATSIDVVRASYEYYSNLLDVEGVGIKTLSGYFLSKVDESVVKNHLIEGIIPEYRPATEEELAQFPGGWKWGSYLTTLLIENRFYLPWTNQKFTAQGGRLVEATINDFSDIKSFGEFEAVFNCSGYGAKKLCNDHKVVAISGQMYNVNGFNYDKFIFAESDTYLIPGHLHTVGGSQHFNSYRTTPCPHDGAAVWTRAKNLLPHLQTSQVRRHWVGVEAHRDGGVRVQAETINGIKVIHNYGHGLNSVSTAPGTSHLALQLAEALLSSNKL